MHMSRYGDILKTQNSFITVGLSHDGSRMQAFRHLDYSYYYLTIYDPETYEILYAKPIDGVNRSSLANTRQSHFIILMPLVFLAQPILSSTHRGHHHIP